MDASPLLLPQCSGELELNNGEASNTQSLERENDQAGAACNCALCLGKRLSNWAVTQKGGQLTDTVVGRTHSPLSPVRTEPSKMDTSDGGWGEDGRWAGRASVELTHRATSSITGAPES